MRRATTRPVHYHEVMPWCPFMELMRTADVSRAWRHESVEATPSDAWDKNLGWDGAMALATHGDKATSTRIADMAEEIRDDAHLVLDHAPDWSATPDGEQWVADIGAAVSGDPEPYRIQALRVPRRYTLTFNVGAREDIHAGPMLQRGAAILAVAQVLLDLGHEVDLTAYICVKEVRTNGRLWLCEIPLTPSPVLMATAAHPAFPRRLGFRLREWWNVQHRFDLYGYGQSYRCAIFKPTESSLDVPAPGGDSDWTNERAKAWALAALRTLTHESIPT